MDEHVRVPAEFLRWNGQVEGREPVEQGGQGDSRLETGQWRPKAVVDAVPEGQVRYVRPREVEAVAAWQMGGVAVGGQ